MTPTTLQSSKRIPKIPAKPLPFIFYILRHCRWQMKLRALVSCVFEIVATASDVLVSWVLGRIVGVIVTATPDELWRKVGYELLLLAGLWTLRNAAYRMREYFERKYAPELMNVTRSLLFNRLIQQSQSFLHGNFAGVLANHVRRGADVIGGLANKLQYNIIPVVVRLATGGALLWAITPQLTLLILGFVALGILSAIKTAPRWTALSTNQAEKSSRLSGYIVDSTTNLSVVQQNVGWPEEQSRLDRAHVDITGAYNDMRIYGSWFWGTFDFVMTFFFCGFMALVVKAWQAGDVTTAQLAMTVGLVMNMFGAVANVVNLLSAKFDDIGILQEALEKISTPLAITDKEGAPDLVADRGAIEFRDVDFAYGSGAPLFQKLSFSIKAGEKVGFVGVSGAGKTSVCQLLLRAHDVNGGGIYIDEQNIAEVTQDSLHDAIAVIPQEPVLFHRTLGENIRYGRQEATPEEVKAAAFAAEAAGFIEKLPKSYDTLVGERGVKLSGGQRQRVAIARAIVKNAPILVLDEATSALDSETEKSIQHAMLTAMKGRTTLVIAHRLSTLSHMDRIIVMDEGRVIETGTFKELMAANGTFARLWNLQAGGFLPEELPREIV